VGAVGLAGRAIPAPAAPFLRPSNAIRMWASADSGQGRLSQRSGAIRLWQMR
jgi:hypothetical protein